MFKRILMYSGLAFVLLFSQNVLAANAKSGLLFNVIASGESTPTPVSISLCLNGRGPLSCQNYTVSAANLTVYTTIPNHLYSAAGIKINTPGHSIAGIGVVCTLISNGYCLFSVSDTSPASFFIVVPPKLSLTATPSTDTNVGLVYSQTNVASGGVAPYTYSLASGTLPAGTTLNTTTGTVSGIPTIAQVFSYTIEVTDHVGAIATAQTSGTIGGTITLTATPSADTEVGLVYAQSNVASGGVAPYTYSLYSGALPLGTSLNAATGTVSGMPISAENFSYTILATDQNGGMAAAPSSGTISGQLTITATQSTITEVGRPYSQTNVGKGGVPPYTYTVSVGHVPPGTSLSSTTGTVSGLPTAADTFSYTITVTDSEGGTASAPSSGTIVSSVTINATPSADTEVGVNYSQTNIASNGTQPYTYSLSLGSLPAGTSLNVSTGLVSGKPTAAGAFSYSITVTDYAGATATAPSSGTIVGSVSMITTPSKDTEVGILYSQTNVASGGVSPYTYSVSAGTIPFGTSLNAATGTVSGMPSTAGPFSYTIQATDSNGAMATGSSSGTIAGVMTLTAHASAVAEVGIVYKQTNSVAGGAPPFSYEVFEGALPSGTGLNGTNGTVTGTPTSAGAFSYTIRVTDVNGALAQAPSSGTILTAVSLTATPSSDVDVGGNYSQANVATGGTTPYKFSLFSGALPINTTLNTVTGVVSGKPTTPGPFSYTIEVTDNVGSTSTAFSGGTIGSTIVLTATPSANTEVNVPYSQSNTAAGGTPPYTYSKSAGTLPTGTTLNSASGLVLGTPTTAGPFSYTIKVTDSVSATATAPTNVTIAGPVTLTSHLSADTEVGIEYSQTNVASGGISPYTYSLSGGGMPPAGTSLNTATGTVSGLPTTAGPFSYTVLVTDSDGATALSPISGTIEGTVNLVATPSKNTEVGVSYSQTNVANGGTTPYVYSLFSGALPSGTSLDPSSGTVSGMPTASGAFSYTILVTDADNAKAMAPSSGTITTAVSLSATPSMFKEVGVNYSQSNTASGGTGTYTFSLYSGSLPAGTTLSSSTGTVTGMPSAAGPFNYTIKVTDSAGSTATASSSGTIVGTVVLNSTPSVDTEVGVIYSQLNAAAGGTPPYSYSISAGMIPAGTSLDTLNGTVSGKPISAGPFSYTVQVTDSDNAKATQPISGTITGAVSLTATPSVDQEVGINYYQTNVASGGVGPYTYSTYIGPLPAGTSLSATTGVVSGKPTTAGSFNYTIQVVDQEGSIALAPSSGTIAGSVTLTSKNSTNTEVNVTYSQTNVASNGVIPYVYTVSAGVPPPGTSLNTASGTVSGTPTTAGPFSYTILVTDHDGALASEPISGTIAGVLGINSTLSPETEVGIIYSQTNQATGGTPPYGYTISTGTLPPGTTLDSLNGTVAGKPTTAGPFNYTVLATDNDGAMALAPISGTIAGTVSINSTPSSATEVGIPYSQTNTAAGGTLPYTYSISVGALPAGTTLDASSGLVSGTPSAAETFSYTVLVTDADGAKATGPISGTIVPAVSLTSIPSKNTDVGINYSQTNMASNGTPPFTYLVLSGTVPTGTSLNTSSGIVSGILTTAGPFSYIVQVTDHVGSMATAQTNVTIGGSLTLTRQSSMYTQVGSTYSQTNTASGGTRPYIYSVYAGTLPAGTTLDTVNGTVSGTPISPGPFSYTILVTDKDNVTAIAPSSGTITSAVTITHTPSNALEVGIPYSQANTAANGTMPYTYSISVGAPPAGTTLNASSGLVSGTPTAAGAFNYTVLVTDADGATAPASTSGTIVAAVGLTAIPSSNTDIGGNYSQVNQPSNGTAPFTFLVSLGTVPAGTTLNTSTGIVSGMPTTAGPYSYTVQVTDHVGSIATAPTNVTIGGRLILTPHASMFTEVNVNYTQTNVVSGGTGPYTYIVSSGTPPAGTTLDTTTGTVSGTPTTAAPFSYTIQVTDHDGSMTTAMSSGTIVPVVSLVGTPSTKNEVGTIYSQTNIASNGTTPYVYSVSSGTLPAGTSLDTATGNVSGKLTASGPFSYTIQVTDAANKIATASSSGTIYSAVGLYSIASEFTEVGVNYIQTNVVTGGQSPYTFSLSVGSLPEGTSLDTSTGIVSGKPTAANTFSYTILVTDGAGATATANSNGTIVDSVVINAKLSTFTEVGVAYSQTNVASLGTKPYSYSIISGTPPPGTTLDSSSGTVSGTPTSAGAFSYTVQVTDAGGAMANVSIPGTIVDAVSIIATPSQDMEVGVDYSQTNIASNGTIPYTYSLSSGALPDGTSLSATTGTVSGKPKTAGPFSYTITVTDAAGAQDTAHSSGTIVGAVKLTAQASQFTEVGVNYSQANIVSGGIEPFTYSLFTGALPAGTTLSASTGVVTGKPTVANTFSYTILVTDGDGATATAPSSGTIVGSVIITSKASSFTEVGVAYSQTNVASLGTPPYSYALTSGALPAGTSLDTTSGTVSGTPTTAGPYSYTITATDAASAIANAPINVTISGAVSLNATPSQYTEVGVNYSQVNTASGGTLPYSYSVSAGVPPSGTTLDPTTGVVTGKPTTAGPFSYFIKVIDADGSMAIAPVNGTITGAVSIASTPSADTEVGLNYFQTNVASGGTIPYTYSISLGSLPAGTTLNTATGTVMGMPITAGPFSYTVLVTDADGSMATSPIISGTIGGTLGLTSQASQYTEVGIVYSQTNVVSGGVLPFTYSLHTGALPDGTSLDPATGTVSGTPTTAAGVTGTFDYSILVTDHDNATAIASTSGTIFKAVTIVAGPYGATEVNVPYSQTNTASQGTRPYTYSSSGTLPDNTTLNPSTGVVSGTPQTAGAFNYTVTVTDLPGSTATTSAITGSVNGPVSLVSTNAPYAEVTAPYNQTNVASGGTLPYTYSVSAGAVPAGTTLNTSTGTVSGIPTTAGSINYTIKVTDANNISAANVINNQQVIPGPVLTATPSANTRAKEIYSQTNVASGGTAPDPSVDYTYTLSAGSLPAGTTLGPSGQAPGTVYGTPTSAGDFLYTITVTDLAGGSATATTSGYMVGSWTYVPINDNGEDVKSVSCLTPGPFCMATVNVADSYAYVYNTVTLGQWSPSGVINSTPLSVSCVNNTNCTAGINGGAAGYVSTYNGSTWNQNPLVFDSPVESVSCTSTGFCMAVTFDGYAYAAPGGVWGPSVKITTNNYSELLAVSCATSDFCMAVDSQGNAYLYDGSWGSPQQIAPAESLSSISCPSIGFCIAVGNDVAITYDGTWGSPVTMSGYYLGSVSCSSSSFCIAITPYSAFIYVNGIWSFYGPLDPSYVTTFLSSISCPVNTFCMAVGATGESYMYQ